MKKIKLILVFAMCAVMMNSCSEDDLVLTNPNQLSPDSFFKNEAQVQSAVNAVYANLQTRGLYTRHMFFMMDNMSHENMKAIHLEADKQQYYDFSFDSSHGAIADYWDSCFRGINKANFVIGNKEKIDEIPDSFLSAAKKAKFIGEAKFLRGFFYFLLVTRFGDVPLITQIPEGGAGFPISPKSEVYAQMITDFTDAASVLLDKGAEDNGRATKGAAQAMLGKTHLFMGNKSAALSAFSSLSGYGLEADYFDNFKEETEHGVESIFEVEYKIDLGSGAVWNSTTSGAGPNEVTFRAQEYGFLNWFNVYPSDDLLNEYEAGDARFTANFYSPGDLYNNGANTVTSANLMVDGVQASAGWKKYQNYYKQPSEVGNVSGINMKVIRYSDVLLMMAECATSVGAAAGYINQVRSRAGLPDTTASTMDEIFDAIVHERKVELAGEQVRFPDIIRWGIAASELSGTNFSSKNELFPIPDREIGSNENVSDADQNPGY